MVSFANEKTLRSLLVEKSDLSLRGVEVGRLCSIELHRERSHISRLADSTCCESPRLLSACPQHLSAHLFCVTIFSARQFLICK